MLSTTYEKTTTELNRMFQLLDKELFDNELCSTERKTVVTIQAKGKHNAYGWCSSAERWNDGDGQSFEINLSAEYLNRVIGDTIQTLIHEMVHLRNIMDDIQDCSRKGTYHNKKFKAGAERVGLVVTESEKHGWNVTALSDDLRIKLGKLFGTAYLIETLGLERISNDGLKLKVKTKKKVTYHYECPDCGQEFKTDKPDLHILCEDCNVMMEMEEI